jgi:Lhr-like helicase
MRSWGLNAVAKFFVNWRVCQDLCKKQPRRIGLSATLGDYSLAAEWLRAGTERSVIISDIKLDNESSTWL